MPKDHFKINLLLKIKKITPTEIQMTAQICDPALLNNHLTKDLNQNPKIYFSPLSSEKPWFGCFAMGFDFQMLLCPHVQVKC